MRADGILAITLCGAALTACGARASETDGRELPIRYARVALADIDGADALAARCGEEGPRLRNHLTALEGHAGEPSVDGYYRSFDSLTASLVTLTSHAESLAAVHPDAALRQAAEDCAQRLTRISTDIGLSRQVYEAITRLDLSGADAVTRHSVDKLLLEFRLAGVDKDDATRDRIRALSDEIVLIGQAFDRNIRDDVRYLELDSIEDLSGLPPDYVAAHPPDDDGRIRISTRYPDVLPFFEYADDDALRREMLMLFRNRGYPQNREVLRKLLAARHELATLVGFDNHAELVIADKMAGAPQRVADFLAEIKDYTTDVQEREYRTLLARLRQDDPDAERLQPWQATYIRSKVRREQYDVDTRVVREYFNYEAVRDGILTLVQELFGVRIERWDTETWHKDVDAFELYDRDELIGRFYLDMHPREGKYQHAAMFPFVTGIDGRQLPLAGLICNFPSDSGPMQHSQVVTFLHEFGHLLHWLFAGHQPWNNVSGITTEWDFVEAPSQMLQEWVWDYETISRFARNAAGEPLPEDLHQRMVAARDFGIGMRTRGQLAYAALSLGLHAADPSGIDIDAVNERITSEYTKFEALDGTHSWAAFSHLNGYSAIYYTYQWSLAIATDMFTRFEDGGMRDLELAKHYRDTVLARGGAAPAEELVSEFLGRPISFEPYAERLRGAPETP